MQQAADRRYIERQAEAWRETIEISIRALKKGSLANRRQDQAHALSMPEAHALSGPRTYRAVLKAVLDAVSYFVLLPLVGLARTTDTPEDARLF
jgi:hypothetical protein